MTHLGNIYLLSKFLGWANSISRDEITVNKTKIINIIELSEETVNHIRSKRIDSVSLFNGISTFVSYSMPKPSS